MADMFASPEGYERNMGRWSARLAPMFLDFLGLKKGAAVLDVGCGTGALAQAVLKREDSATITGIDPAESLVEYCKSRFASERAQFKSASAEKLPYPDGTFDYTLALLVFSFVHEADRSAREMRRVTRPGGIVGACAWHAEGLSMDRVFFEEAGTLDAAARSKAERLRRLSREGQLEALWTKIGLREVNEVHIDMDMEFQSFDDYWIPLTEGAGPVKAYASDLTPHQREMLREKLVRRLVGDRADGPFKLSARALAVKGRLPG
jgi:SAM-dependent methyltransferase